MMKNFTKLMLVLVITISLTACGSKNKKEENKEDKYTLTCAGDYALLSAIVSKRVYDSETGEIETSISFNEPLDFFDTGEYVFKFNDDGIISFSSKETLNKNASDEYDIEGKRAISDNCYVDKVDGKVIYECLEDAFDINVIAFNESGYTTKDKLKEILENETSLKCN